MYIKFEGVVNVFAVFGIFVFLLVIAGIALYLLFAFGLYRMAKNQNLENSWIAFIPVVQMYIIGKLIKNLQIFGYAVPMPEIVLPSAIVVNYITKEIAVIGFLVGLAVFILNMFAMYELFKKYKGEKAVTMMVISVVTLGIMGAVYIFQMREDKQIEQQSVV